MIRRQKDKYSDRYEELCEIVFMTMRLNTEKAQ